MGKLWAEQARLNSKPLLTAILFKSSWPENFGAELPTGSRMNTVKYQKYNWKRQTLSWTLIWVDLLN